MPNDPIGIVLDHVRSLPDEMGIFFPRLETIERKLASQTPLTEEEIRTWHEMSRVVSRSGDEEVRRALEQSNERFRALTEVARVPHPFFRRDLHAERRLFIGIDIRRLATELQEREVVVSPARAEFDYSQLKGIERNGHFIDFSHAGRHWTVLLPDPKTGMTFAHEFRLDSLILARIHLLEAGYLGEGEDLTVHEDVRFTAADAIKLGPHQQMPGFSVRLLESEEFAPLITVSGADAAGPPAVELNPAITAESAGKLLANLKTLAASLRWAGLAMNPGSWEALKFDVKRERLIFGERVRPVILDSERFSAVLDEKGWVDALEDIPGDALFVPDLHAYATSNHDMISSQEMLLRTVGLLAEKAGEMPHEVIHDGAHELVGFHLAYDRDGQDILAKFVERYSGTILKIIQYYIRTLGNEGLNHFLNVIFPALLMRSRGNYQNLKANSQDWFETAKKFIDAARLKAGGKPLEYWMANHDSLLMTAKVIPIRKKGPGNAGTPQNPGQEAGGGAGGATEVPGRGVSGVTSLIGGYRTSSEFAATTPPLPTGSPAMTPWPAPCVTVSTFQGFNGFLAGAALFRAAPAAVPTQLLTIRR